jgi:hypothetical protein
MGVGARGEERDGRFMYGDIAGPLMFFPKCTSLLEHIDAHAWKAQESFFMTLPNNSPSFHAYTLR